MDNKLKASDVGWNAGFLFKIDFCGWNFLGA